MFHGNLYNYNEIKEDLINKNYILHTTTDTELVLLTYIIYKEKCLEILDGAFSFVIYENNKLFMARDRLGIKPLYYYNSNVFIFSTEIKGILKHSLAKAKIGKDEICEIFGLGPAHSPGKTFFKDIFEILPGHYAIFESNKFTTTKYWDVETIEINDSLEESINKVKYLVTNSLNEQLITDKPICSMLSRWSRF